MNLRRAAQFVWVTLGLSLVFRVFGMLRDGYDMYDMYGGSLFRQSLFLLPDAALVLFFFILWTELKKR
jgi:EamA domain-containing membrane protein RarD